MTGTINLNVDYCREGKWTVHTVEYNAYHVTIRPATHGPQCVDDNNVYARGSAACIATLQATGDCFTDGMWLDEPHTRVTKALKELHNALEALIKHDRALIAKRQAEGLNT